MDLNSFCATQNMSTYPAPCHRTLIPANRVSSGHSSKPPDPEVCCRNLYFPAAPGTGASERRG